MKIVAIRFLEGDALKLLVQWSDGPDQVASISSGDVGVVLRALVAMVNERLL